MMFSAVQRTTHMNVGLRTSNEHFYLGIFFFFFLDNGQLMEFLSLEPIELARASFSTNNGSILGID